MIANYLWTILLVSRRQVRPPGTTTPLAIRPLPSTRRQNPIDGGRLPLDNSKGKRNVQEIVAKYGACARNEH